MSTDAVIVSTARTPIGKAHRGALTGTHGAALGAHVIRAALERAGCDGAEVDDVLLGSAHPEGATGNNIARVSALQAGLPDHVAGMTVDRKCASGLQTIALAAQRIRAGEDAIFVAGGLDSVSMVMPHKNLTSYHSPWVQAHRPDLMRPSARAGRGPGPPRSSRSATISGATRRTTTARAPSSASPPPSPKGGSPTRSCPSPSNAR